MKKRKSIPIIMTALILCAILAGCGSQSNSFTRAEAMTAMLGVDDDLSPEEYIKAALKNRV